MENPKSPDTVEKEHPWRAGFWPTREAWRWHYRHHPNGRAPSSKKYLTISQTRVIFAEQLFSWMFEQFDNTNFRVHSLVNVKPSALVWKLFSTLAAPEK
jgi:hypothetical protein